MEFTKFMLQLCANHTDALDRAVGFEDIAEVESGSSYCTITSESGVVSFKDFSPILVTWVSQGHCHHPAYPKCVIKINGLVVVTIWFDTRKSEDISKVMKDITTQVHHYFRSSFMNARNRA